MAALTEFRWIEWNVDHATSHDCSIFEIESVVRHAGHGFPRKLDREKWLVIGRGSGDPMIRVIYCAGRSAHGVCGSCDATDDAAKTWLKGVSDG